MASRPAQIEDRKMGIDRSKRLHEAPRAEREAADSKDAPQLQELRQTQLPHPGEGLIRRLESLRFVEQQRDRFRLVGVLHLPIRCSSMFSMCLWRSWLCFSATS
jgi:hypothetical protein